jgi:putative Mg2+ transporter-C (MgtC) family protein
MLESGSFSVMNYFALAFPHLSLSEILARDLLPLALAALLGGIIGFEREWKHRPAGLRTNLFICFGAAMFTVLSGELVGSFGGGDRTRIAAQIIPGIGFIGAGSILHARQGVSGLTTAATIFVVASIGMACGGGLYGLAIFATTMILLCLELLGRLERQFNLKPLLMSYSVVTGKGADEIVAEVNGVLEDQGKEMQSMRLSKSNGRSRVIFCVSGTRSEHKELMDRLRQTSDLHDFEATPDRETD